MVRNSPTLVGSISERAGGDLKVGLLIATILSCDFGDRADPSAQYEKDRPLALKRKVSSPLESNLFSPIPVPVCGGRYFFGGVFEKSGGRFLDKRARLCYYEW